MGPIICVLSLVKIRCKEILLFVTLTSYLKRAVAKDRGEDGSGQHGDDGQDHRHAVCGGREKELICFDST